MSGEWVSPDTVPPVCKFFRDVIADSELTEHDITVVAQHTRECAGCEATIGQMIHEKIQSNKQAEASGT